MARVDLAREVDLVVCEAGAGGRIVYPFFAESLVLKLSDAVWEVALDALLFAAGGLALSPAHMSVTPS